MEVGDLPAPARIGILNVGCHLFLAEEMALAAGLHLSRTPPCRLALMRLETSTVEGARLKTACLPGVLGDTPTR